MPRQVPRNYIITVWVASGYVPTDADLQTYGFTRDEYDSLKKSATASARSGVSGPGTNTAPPGFTYDQAKLAGLIDTVAVAISEQLPQPEIPTPQLIKVLTPAPVVIQSQADLYKAISVMFSKLSETS